MSDVLSCYIVKSGTGPIILRIIGGIGAFNDRGYPLRDPALLRRAEENNIGQSGQIEAKRPYLCLSRFTLLSEDRERILTYFFPTYFILLLTRKVGKRRRSEHETKTQHSVESLDRFLVTQQE